MPSEPIKSLSLQFFNTEFPFLSLKLKARNRDPLPLTANCLPPTALPNRQPSITCRQLPTANLLVHPGNGCIFDDLGWTSFNMKKFIRFLLLPFSLLLTR